MTPPAERPHDEHLHQLIHDVKDSLHVVGMGMEVLKEVRTDDMAFVEVVDSMQRELQKAFQRLSGLLNATCEGCGRPLATRRPSPPASPGPGGLPV